LIIPGYMGSGEQHWQTWMQTKIQDATRVEQLWDAPVLATWVENVESVVEQATEPVWLVAHSFGCLVSVLVAPADPERFTPSGLRAERYWDTNLSVKPLIPTQKLNCPSLIIASDDDPWMQISKAKEWGELWGSQLEILSAAGHINTASGYGPWPAGLERFQKLKEEYSFS
jgi:uncharacterized protein